jgi:hypothetical protein
MHKENPNTNTQARIPILIGNSQRVRGWRDGGMEGWRDGGMEGWRDGRMEEWRDGGMEGGDVDQLGL